MRKLSHLNALYALEATARLGNFTRAAEELAVTPAAVGQQVRLLENYLGRKLFHRSRGTLIPTPAAATALEDLHKGFNQLEAAFEQLSGPAPGHKLAVSAAPALAGKWLAPRMIGLYQRIPHIDLRIDTSLQLANIAAGEFDLAIRFGTEVPKGLNSTHLFQEYILPICAPDLLPAQTVPIAEEFWRGIPLLHIDGETSDRSVPSWQHWGERYNFTERDWNSGPRFPHSIMAIEAAMNGQGAVLCGLTLVIDDLTAGRLVAPLGSSSLVATMSTYQIIHPPLRRLSTTQASFIHWLKAEASQTRAVLDRFLETAPQDLREAAP